MHKIAAALLLLTTALTAAPAQAYVGPGSSLGAIGVFLGLVATVLLTLISFVWYPIKRMVRRARHKDATTDDNAE